MDGTALPAVDAAPPEEYPPFNAQPTSRTDAAVERRLSNLGYIDDNEY
jgi:hypothetical protein